MELLSRHPALDIHRHLIDDERIVYRDNGNRACTADEMLEKLRPLLPLMGISRVAEITQLLPFDYPVFQTIRPNVYYHSATGQNTGSQGKGPTVAQAKLSAIMESLEGFCAEPRNPGTLIRGSYAFLRGQHAVVNPAHLLARDVDPPRPDTSLVWTEACELTTGETVLVPAETVFFPFLAADYDVPNCFPCGSNGLASGATYLEAVLHGLYELIERHYMALREAGRLRVERFHLGQLIDLEDFAASAPDYAIRMYSLEMPGTPNLPMVMCVLMDQAGERNFAGYGCCSNVDIAVSRAYSEAWQSAATYASGAREDMTRGTVREPKEARPLPEDRTLHPDDYRSRVADLKFDSLRAEFDFLLDWLGEKGIGVICAANLTRRGIDVPVVKLVVPGLLAPRRNLRPAVRLSTYDVCRARHRRPS